jgi:hypothetical protein
MMQEYYAALAKRWAELVKELYKIPDPPRQS